MSEIVQHIRRAVLLPDRVGSTDGQLLEEYISRRNQTAFAVLVRRLGPLVWNVCRRILCNEQDVEDAFQATFLVFVRKAASIAPSEKVADWLYGVACQTARKARATAARRKERERPAAGMPEPAAPDQSFRHDLKCILDVELGSLPGKYRAVIVLCDLQGRSRKEAARQIGCPEGTVAGRIARARVMLAKRLGRHGLTVSGGVLAGILAQEIASARVPASWVNSTINLASLFTAGQEAAGEAISVNVAAVTNGVLKTMSLNKVKTFTTRVLLALLIVTIVGSSIAPSRKALLWAEQSDERSEPKTFPTQLSTDRTVKPRTDEQEMQGTWKVTAAAENGESGKVEGEGLEATVTIRQGTLHIKAGEVGKPPTMDAFFVYKLDATTTPKSIDLADWKKGFEEGQAIEAIYSLDADSMRICFASGSFGEKSEKKNRPSNLEAKKGSNSVVWILKRQKKCT